MRTLLSTFTLADPPVGEMLTICNTGSMLTALEQAAKLSRKSGANRSAIKPSLKMGLDRQIKAEVRKVFGGRVAIDAFSVEGG